MEFDYKNIIKSKNRRIKELLYFNDILEKQHIEKMKEIERLNNIIKNIENIIKEVREYIENDMKKYGGDVYITCKDILEILGRENNDK